MLHNIDNFYTVIDLAYFEGESNNLDYRFVRIKIIFGLGNRRNIFQSKSNFGVGMEDCFGYIKVISNCKVYPF